jgi:hypothetical protein
VAALRRGETDPTCGLPLLPREGLEGRLHGCRSDWGQRPPAKLYLGRAAQALADAAPMAMAVKGAAMAMAEKGTGRSSGSAPSPRPRRPPRRTTAPRSTCGAPRRCSTYRQWSRAVGTPASQPPRRSRLLVQRTNHRLIQMTQLVEENNLFL